MKNDTPECRAEFVKWLKDTGLYNEFASALTMQKMNDVYWTMKELNTELLEALKAHLNPLFDSMEAHKMMLKAIAKATEA